MLHLSKKDNLFMGSSYLELFGSLKCIARGIVIQLKRRRASEHRGSILVSHPATPGSVLAIPKKFPSMLLRFINGVGWRKVDIGLSTKIWAFMNSHWTSNGMYLCNSIIQYHWSRIPIVLTDSGSVSRHNSLLTTAVFVTGNRSRGFAPQR